MGEHGEDGSERRRQSQEEVAARYYALNEHRGHAAAVRAGTLAARAFREVQEAADRDHSGGTHRGPLIRRYAFLLSLIGERRRHLDDMVRCKSGQRHAFARDGGYFLGGRRAWRNRMDYYPVVDYVRFLYYSTKRVVDLFQKGNKADKVDYFVFCSPVW